MPLKLTTKFQEVKGLVQAFFVHTWFNVSRLLFASEIEKEFLRYRQLTSTTFLSKEILNIVIVFLNRKASSSQDEQLSGMVSSAC